MSTTPSPTEVSWSDSRFAGDALRTRFRPPRRIHPFFVAIVPWIDALLLAAYVLFISYEHSRLPGMAAELPGVPFKDTVKPSLVFVVNSPTEGNGPFVFFDERRYNLADATQRQKLSNAIGENIPIPADSAEAVLFVDKAVRFEDLADLLALLRESDLSRVFFATRTP